MNVLIAPIGTESQVVTTTFDLLRLDRVTIEKIIVLHSESKGNQALIDAVTRLQNALEEIPNITYEMRPFSRNGKGVDTMGSKAEVKTAFYSLYNAVRLEKNAGNTVYLQAAGGRKITSAYAMLTAQMLFDNNDRLLYLLSQGNFLQSRALYPRSTQDYKETTLLEIPFLSWKTMLPSIEDLKDLDDPDQAFEHIQGLEFQQKYEKADSFIKSLTDRQKEILDALIHNSHMSSKELANHLYISEKTLETFSSQLREKAKQYWGFETRPDTKQLCALVWDYYHNELKNTGGKQA